MLPADETTQEPETLAASLRHTTAPDGLTAEAVEAVNGLVWIALTAAGSKMRRSAIVPRDHRPHVNSLPAAIIHTRYKVAPADLEQRHLLETAFDHVPEVASRHGMSPDCLADTLHEYVTHLITTGHPHVYTQVPPLITGCMQEAADA